ncbi:MAG TPA: transketolase [Terracidiphilus sp.]|nr:transketolase [Terracidiphilus sp.]
MARPDEIQRIQRIAWDLRADVVRMIGVGKPGHLGGSCSLAEIAAALYFAKMHFDPQALHDPCRDRFLLSKGHSVLIQYAALTELGIIPREELDTVKTLAGKLQGHPDMLTPGMEAVTGSLGQGLSIAVGMALALRITKSPSRVYVIMGDGELAEGQLWEAAMAASRYKLDAITGILDRNRIQATGPTQEIFDIPGIDEKFRAFGWNVLSVNGHDVGAVLDVLDEAAAKKGAPTLIIAETTKGKGVSFAENTAAFHNGAMSREQYDQALREIEESRRMLQ